jgi:predicted lipid-binding transport protein (Tim44 family)
MNKYFVKIPYSYSRYGTLSCFVYAEDSEEAEELAMAYDNRVSEDFDDSDSDGDTEYEYNDMTVELDEEDVDSPDGSNNESAITLAMQLPCRYINDLVLL